MHLFSITQGQTHTHLSGARSEVEADIYAGVFAPLAPAVKVLSLTKAGRAPFRTHSGGTSNGSINTAP